MKELNVIDFTDVFSEGLIDIAYPEDSRTSSNDIDIIKYLKGAV